MTGKIGVIDVGGGMRGIYAAGVFDRLIEDGVRPDLCIGISAGSANIVSFIAGQKGRNRLFYSEYALRKEYMSLANLLHKGSYIDLEYVYGTLSNHDGENPLDYAAFLANPTQCCVVATDAETGEPAYFGKQDMPQNDYRILMASSAIPAVCRPIEINGRNYFDGALGDTVPLQKALDMGCEKIILLLTKPRDEIRLPNKDERYADLIGRKYPAAAARLRLRAEKYNQGVQTAKEMEKEGRALIIAPDDTCGVDTLTKNKQQMLLLYDKGYRDGAAVKTFIRN